MPSLWFGREFAFTFPVELFPNVLERVRGTPARLEELLRGLPREVLTRRDGERWSMQEHAGHLLDLEALELQRLDDYEARRTVLTPADLENRRTYEARYNERAVEDILRAFRAERAELVRRLETLGPAAAGLSALHPRLQQPMRLIDMVFFTAEHDDHHLAHISELIRLFVK
ncbi:MAG TPA: DinB family protein [Pyrinomonadaceae bacterium]|jgi:uncharacterized damage-inducible protein DinB